MKCKLGWWSLTQSDVGKKGKSQTSAQGGEDQIFLNENIQKWQENSEDITIKTILIDIFEAVSV